MNFVQAFWQFKAILLDFRFSDAYSKNSNSASVAELVYALGLEPSAERLKGSSPFARTSF